MALKWRNILAVTLAALLCATAAFADVVKFTSCDANLDEDAEPMQRNCTVQEVRISPCPEAAKGDPCKIKRGNSASISVDFTPTFDDSELSGRAYWSNQLVDLPLLGMDTQACNYTSCPLKANQKQTYTYNLEISNFFPVRAYNVKWKLWNDKTECCFVTGIKLIK
ncbi:hypothetical protein ONE63_001715 [Megalurothrips usitatus]|uniref:MD-2-related lipid-recognition domain-containing protein n=1 Tax=Megalurothrips usitatus TaxID=439358 RepID=A0AAV7X963_9NEOP|nr:hypothetical protein ONE63_001715 [Megalurothrips usitatus]